jgi:prepilin-type processing-associated H-X9-DG protein
VPSSTDRSLPLARFGVAEHFRPGEQDRVERVVPGGVSLDDAGRLDVLFGDGHAALFDALGLHIPAVGARLTAEQIGAFYDLLDAPVARAYWCRLQEWGLPDDWAWERAHAYYLDHFEHFSDVQLDRSKPLHALECANPNQRALS